MHWSRKYVGTPYDEHDCASLLNRVAREQFNVEMNLPEERPANPFGRSLAINAGKERFAKVTERSPQEGDAVLMRGRRRLWHVGVYAHVSEPCVLHAMSITGGACVHRIRELPTYGLELEGFYEWLG